MLVLCVLINAFIGANLEIIACQTNVTHSEKKQQKCIAKCVCLIIHS